ncbi:MAG: PEGA domain-containing protein [Acidobacteriota bacterium]
MKAVTGKLQLDSKPGLEVHLDGRLVGVTTAKDRGLRIEAVDAGEHMIRVSSPGHLTTAMKVVVQPGTTTEVNAGQLPGGDQMSADSTEEPVEMTVQSPPMIADDAGTAGDGNFEVNLVLDGDLARRNQSGEVPLLDVNYGYHENLQFKFELPYVISHVTATDGGGGSQRSDLHGVGNSNFGVKYRFYNNEATHLALGIYPQVDFHTPGAPTEADGGGASGATTWSLPVLLTKEFERMAIAGNLGFDVTTEHPHAGIFGVFGAGTRLTRKLALLGEIAGFDINQSDARRIVLNVGFRRKLTDTQTIGAAVGHDLRAGADGKEHTYITVAYQRSIEKK